MISRVQFATGADTLTGTTTITLGAAPTSGNLLVAVIGDADSVTVASISQTGVTWHKAIGQTPDPGQELWYGNVGGGASATITITKSSAVSDTTAIVAEYQITPGTLDQTAQNAGNSATPDSGTTVSTTSPTELIVAGLTQVVGTTAVFSAPTNGFTIVSTISVSGAMTTGYLEKIVSTTGTQNTSVSSNVSNSWAGVIATFQGTGNSNQLMMTGIGS